MLHNCFYYFLGSYCAAPFVILIFDYINDLLDMVISSEREARTLASFMVIFAVAPLSVILMIITLLCRLVLYLVILMIFAVVKVYKIIHREKK